jgi:hypothetical protein
MNLDVVEFWKRCHSLQPRWFTITIQAARVPTPKRYDAIRLELTSLGDASNLFPNTAPKEPQGIALIKVT